MGANVLHYILKARDVYLNICLSVCLIFEKPSIRRTECAKLLVNLIPLKCVFIAESSSKDSQISQNHVCQPTNLSSLAFEYVLFQLL